MGEGEIHKVAHRYSKHEQIGHGLLEKVFYFGRNGLIPFLRIILFQFSLEYSLMIKTFL